MRRRAPYNSGFARKSRAKHLEFQAGLYCNNHGYYSRPIEGVNSNLRSPMLNSLREWGERRSTRVFALKIAQKRLEFEGVCTVTNHAQNSSGRQPVLL